MSSTYKDFAELERLLVNDKRGRTTVFVPVQSATIPENAPSIQQINIGSVDIVNFLPVEATNGGKELEFFVPATGSANYILKNLSGDVKLVVPPNGYGKAVNIRSVWYGAVGGVTGTLSQVALGADQTPGFTSAASAIGYSSITEANLARDLLNKMKNLMIAHGWAIT